MQTKTKKVVLGMVAGVFGLCAVSGVYFGAKLSKANTAEPTVITMEKGASMRLDADAPALRYFATLSDVKKGYDYGMIIVNAEELSSVTGNYHAELEAGNYVDVACVPYTEGGKTYIRGALTDVFTTDNFCESYFTQYVAIGYEKAADDTYIYATVDETYARSLVSTARRCELLDKEWTSEEQTALDYFVSVANSRLEDDFANGLSETKFTATNADVEAYARLNGGYDITPATYIQTEIYENITSVEFDLYAAYYVNWVGVAFGDEGSCYRTPVMLQKNAISGVCATATKVNTVSFNFTESWVNFKFDIKSDTEATLYINGVEAYTITNYKHTNNKTYFTHGRVTISSAGVRNQDGTIPPNNDLYLDNVKIAYGENQVLEQDFSTGLSPMIISGDVTLVNNGVKVQSSSAMGSTCFLFDKSSTSYGYGHGQLKTGTYSGITEFGFDLTLDSVTTTGFFVGFGASVQDYPMFKIRNSHIEINGNCGTGVGINGNALSAGRYTYDFTKTTSVKVTVDGATAASLYLNGTKVAVVTVTNPVNQFTDLTGSQNVWLRNGGNEGSAKVDNLYVTTASGTVMETFDTVLSSSVGTGYNGTYVFPNASATNIVSSVFEIICPKVEMSYTYDSYKSANGLTVKEGFNVPDTAAATDAVMEVMATVQGDSVSYVVGESATDKGISLVVIENGKMFVRNVTDTTVVDGEAIDVDISTATVVAVRVTAGGTVYVSINGGEILTLGTANYIGGNFAILETSGASAAYITDIAIKMQVYA